MGRKNSRGKYSVLQINIFNLSIPKPWLGAKKDSAKNYNKKEAMPIMRHGLLSFVFARTYRPSHSLPTNNCLAMERRPGMSNHTT